MQRRANDACTKKGYHFLLVAFAVFARRASVFLDDELVFISKANRDVADLKIPCHGADLPDN